MNQQLVRYGVVLTLLASLSGVAPMVVTNARMGLAAHVGGIMNALLLLALGAVWSMITLSPKRERLATRLLVVGASGNWSITLLASITGAKEFAPLAGAGYGANAAVEKGTLLLITTAAVCTLVGLGLVLSGWPRGARVEQSAEGAVERGAAGIIETALLLRAVSRCGATSYPY